MATTVLTSTPTKEKKKNSSSSKQHRATGGGTLKVRHSCLLVTSRRSFPLQRNPKYELKKDELIQMLGRFEGELQAKEIALAALKVTSSCFELD